MKKVSLLLGIGLLCVSLSSLAGEVITNDTGEDATGLRVVFSSPVLITGSGDVFTTVDPQMLSYEFVFSGGTVEPWGSHWLNWVPTTARIMSHEWVAKTLSHDSSTQNSLTILGDNFILGARLSSYLVKRVWDGVWRTVDPLEMLRDNGFEWACIQMRTTSSQFLSATSPAQWGTLPWRDEYWCSLELAKQMLLEAQAAGFRLWLYLNLTDDDAMGAYQHAPKEWAGLTLEQTAGVLEQYTFEVVSALLNEGVNIEIYSMSGEIEWGILDFGPAFNAGGRIRFPVPGEDIMDYMNQEVWPLEAKLLQAGIRGVRRADPDALILLYVSGISFFPSPQYDNIRTMIPEFFESMAEHHVDFDIAGFSWVYPYCGECWPFPGISEAELSAWVDAVTQRIAALGKPIIIAEAGYPSSPAGVEAQYPMPSYPYTPEGQSDMIESLLTYAWENPSIQGFFYFAPEWIPRPYHTVAEYHMDGNSLFNENESSKPALDVFGTFTDTE
jgi:arabinogalactan endo-1,4-beta-galactosidase